MFLRFALTFLLFFLSRLGFGDDCAAIIEQLSVDGVALTTAQRAWQPSHFTHPSRHDPKKFRYIVVAGPHITPEGEKDVVSAFMKGARSRDFNQNKLFSTSIVDQDHTATFNHFGVILHVPSDKIIAVTPEDMRSHVSNRMSDEEVARRIPYFYKMHRLPSPERLLQDVSRDTGFFRSDLRWSEVLLYGKAKSNDKIAVNGLFHHEDSLRKPLLTDEKLETMKAAAHEMKVPLVSFPPPTGEYVLKVRMRGARTPKDSSKYFMKNFGPQSIRFYGTKDQVRRIFEKAASEGKTVRLVDETHGPTPLLMDREVFDGTWKELEPYIPPPLPPLKPSELPEGVDPIEFSFGDR